MSTVLISAHASGTGALWPAIITLGAACGMYVAGRVLAPALPAVAALVLGTTALVLMVSPGALSGGPLAPPLRYGNADAALYVQLAALAALASVTARSSGQRAVWLLTVTTLVVFTGLTNCLAGLLGGVAVLAVLAGILIRGNAAPRRALAWCLALVVAFHATVFAIGATYRTDRPSPVHHAVAAAVSERRLALWSDAVSIARQHPLTGTGPRTFPALSPTARYHPDTRETHSATLQAAAEVGWPGAAALLGLLLWAVTRPLLTVRGSSGAAVVTATAGTALAVHASLDYVLSFPVVIGTAALVLGVGTGLAAAPAAHARVPQEVVSAE